MVHKSSLLGSVSRSDLLAAGLVAAFVGLLGLWPHLKFVHEIGEFRYFHGAYDEDTYVLSWWLGTLRSTRALSGLALSAVYRLCGSSLDATLVGSDFLFPFLATCAAYFAVSQIVAGKSAKILAVLLLVFADDLFSLGNLVVWSSGTFSLAHFSAIVGRIHPDLVPSSETSFLAIFRTPEPQASFVLMFLTLGLLARSTVVSGTRERAILVATIVAIALLPIGYTFVTLPVAAVAGGLMLVLGYFRRTSAIPILLGLIGAALVAFGALYFDRNGGQTTAGMAADLTYPTRAPIITPAVLGSLIFGGLLAGWMLRHRRFEPLAFLALGCLVLPLLLSNQQILTGTMFSARDWERTVHYPILLFGIIAALSVVAPFRALPQRWFATGFSIGSAIIVFIVVRAERESYRDWRGYNMESVAIARALQAVDPVLAGKARLVFDNAGIAVVMQVRTKGQVNPVMSFYSVAMNFIPSMTPDATRAVPSHYEHNVFEHWFRTGVSPEAAERLLRSEIQQRAGLYLNYLFSFRDAWYPASDNRAVRQPELERSVGPVIDRYRDFLASTARCDVFDLPALLASVRPPGDITQERGLDNRTLAQGSAGGVVAHIYRQTSRDPACGGQTF